MSITINGTTGIAGVDGSAATPSVQGADANTGVFFPAADTVALTTGGSERLRVDSSGNVGIGTNNPQRRLDVTSSSSSVARFFGNNANNYIELSDNNGAAVATIGSIGGGNMYTYSAGYNAMYAGGSERMRIDSSGNVGIGTTVPGAKLDVTNNQAALSYLIDTNNSTNGGSSIWRMITRNIANTGTTSVEFYKPTGSGFSLLNNDTNASNFTAFNVGASERMRIDSSGNVLFGLTSSIGTGVAQFRGGIRGDNSSGDVNFAIESRSGGTLYSSSIYNSTTAAGASVSITGTAGFLQRSTSSIKYKTDVEDLYQSLSANIYQMRPVWYRSKCEMDRKDWSYLGLIAEEVAEIEPRLVHWGEVKEDGTQEPEGVMYDRLTVLLLAEVKKQQAIITALEARIAALEAK